MRYSKEQQELASDIVKAISTNCAQSFEDVARKVRISRKLAAELCNRLCEYQVLRMTTYRRRKIVEVAPNLCSCDERTKELWVLGALHEDM